MPRGSGWSLSRSPPGQADIGQDIKPSRDHALHDPDGQWMGQRDIRRLWIIGALTQVRWAIKNGRPKGSWLEQMLERKPRMLVALALANKTARTIWPMMTKHEDYRDPIAAV
jgi:hypothetical protein